MPTIAKTEAGYWLNIEPVERVGIDDAESISSALFRTAERSGHVVLTPSRASFPKSILLAYSTAKSLNAFEKQYAQLSIDRTGDGYFRINGYKKSPEGSGYLPDNEQAVVLPVGSSLRDVANELIAIVRRS